MNITSSILIAEKMLIEMLEKHSVIGKMISGVYVYLPENVKLPYIHIHKISTKDYSTKTFQSTEIKINLHCHSNEKGNTQLSIIQDEITRMFANKRFDYEGNIFLSSLTTSEIAPSKKGSNYTLNLDINLKHMEN
ncbi:MAG: DUF3168 domain-containing protein [Alphaproteobacteria bacterium]|nr:DUF3168 domain-containing protein [Alphaproteobacteria bacterium]OJV14116.1 MAG: hypothetical protein BGO27_01350 [Alphaproteobacteria bacterium 33-17]